MPAKIAHARHRKLMSAPAADRAPEERRRCIGRELEVLVEGPSDENEFVLEGRRWGQAPEIDGQVYLANGEAGRGEIRQALVTAAADYDLVADLLGEDGTHDSPIPAPKPKKRVALKTVA